MNSIIKVSVLSLGFAVMSLACTTNSEQNNAIAQASTTGNVILSPTAFKDSTENKKVQLLDVRTKGEFEKGHLNDALNIDINDSEFENVVAQLDKNKPVFVYCKGGGRSKEASEKLAALGFKSVYDLKGGIMAWENANLPLAKGEQGSQEVEKSEYSLQDFDKLITENEFVVVDFNAVWCGPCKKLSPVLDEMATKYAGKVKLVKIDVDKSPELAKALNIQGIPYVLKYKNGKVVDEMTGFDNTPNGIKAVESLFN